jgi:hypothetical protein
VRVARLPWYSGIGIHYTANGWLYNVASGLVVQIEGHNGHRVNIGTLDAEALRAAIAAHLGAPSAPAPDVPHAHGMPWPAVSVLLTTGVVLLVGAVVIWNGRQPVSASIDRGLFAVRGAGRSTNLRLGEITSVTLADVLPKVERRTFGFAFGDRLRGTFHLAGIGAASVYVNADTPPFIVVRTPREVVFVNEPTAAETRRLYDELRAAAPSR